MKWLGVALLVCLVVPATATAARVELRPGAVAGENEFAYTAGPDEVNNAHIDRVPGLPSGSSWIVQDREHPPTERVPPCLQGLDGYETSCPDDHVTSIVVDLGDRDDLAPLDAGFTLIYMPVAIYGGPGRDRLDMHSEGGNLLDGGPGNDVIVSERQDGFFGPDFRGGADTVNGGDGDDEIRTRDRRRDVISCGPGMDEVFADELDVVGGDCESVTRPWIPSPPSVVWTRADGRQVGVTINGSARYTNDRDVVLTVLHPPSASSMLLSNDGGFSTWSARSVRDRERYRFQLSSSGPERLPKTVYVRFDLDPTRTFTDDIVLDQRPPTVMQARLVGWTRSGRVRISLKARDSTSGVRIVQFARARRHPWATVKFRKRLAVRGIPTWVRVRDRAGNVSRWERVTR